MIQKDQRNITTLKGSTWLLFTAATQHLTPAVMKYKKTGKGVIPLKHSSLTTQKTGYYIFYEMFLLTKTNAPT
jgi:hypothetical protein